MPKESCTSAPPSVGAECRGRGVRHLIPTLVLYQRWYPIYSTCISSAGRRASIGRPFPRSELVHAITLIFSPVVSDRPAQAGHMARRCKHQRLRPVLHGGVLTDVFKTSTQLQGQVQRSGPRLRPSGARMANRAAAVLFFPRSARWVCFLEGADYSRGLQGTCFQPGGHPSLRPRTLPVVGYAP